MVNSQVISEIINALKLDINVDKIPTPLPVVEVGLKLTKTAFTQNSQQNTTGAFTIFTPRAGVDTYRIGLEASYIKDATCDLATGYFGIYCNINGISKYLCYFTGIALTASNGIINISFSHPIKVDRGTAVAFGGSFTAGVLSRAACIYYYEDEIS